MLIISPPTSSTELVNLSLCFASLIMTLNVSSVCLLHAFYTIECNVFNFNCMPVAPTGHLLTYRYTCSRCAVVSNGMWDQVRVDHGKEFYLCLYMQEILSRHRYNLTQQPYLQTTSSRVSFSITTLYYYSSDNLRLWEKKKSTLLGLPKTALQICIQ